MTQGFLSVAVLVTLSSTLNVSADYSELSVRPLHEDAAFNPACCLPYFATNNYGRPKPIFDELLFKVCPKHKTPEEICKGATELLVDPPSKLQFSHFETPVNTNFIYNKWQSTTTTDIAVVTSGCCSNIYADVKPGQTLNSLCLNPLLGSNQMLVNSVFGTSVMVAGSADIWGTFERSVVVGKDWLNTSGEQSTISSTGTGPFESYGFTLAGSSFGADGVIVVNNNMALLSTECGEDCIVEADEISILQNPEEAVERISSQICAISNNIAALETNSRAVICPANPEASNGGNKISFSCNGNDDPCVFAIPATTIEAIIKIYIEAPAGRTIKINVLGALAVTNGFLNEISNSGASVIWNFKDASEVRLQYGDMEPLPNWPGSILCPHCDILELTGGGIDGTIGMAKRGSLLTVKHPLQKAFAYDAPFGAPTCPDPVPTVTFCHCLCPKDPIYEEIAKRTDY